MRVFMTGATGVVGRRLVPLLKNAGHEVTAAVRSSAARAELTTKGVRAIEVNLFDSGAVSRAVAGQDVVVNLATHIPDPSRMFLPWAWRENDRLRRVASAILVDASLASMVGRFVQESFAPVYPESGSQWIDERVSLSPLGFNRSILDAEASAERFAQAGRAGVVLRFGGFYGHDAFQTTEMIKYIKKGWAPLPGSPGAYLSSLAHDDAATAAAAALTLPAGIYNAVDDEPMTHRAFVDSLAEVLGVRAPKLLPAWITPLFGSLGALPSRSLRISNNKLRSASGWTPTYSNARQGWGAVVAQLGNEPLLFRDLARPAKHRGD